ncbi:LOW QUALITY PROTEIN: hypothetical protein BSCG_05731, partial [Bacteroides sp. 2_2_4]
HSVTIFNTPNRWLFICYIGKNKSPNIKMVKYHFGI